MIDFANRKDKILITTVPPKAKGGIVGLHQVLFDLPHKRNFIYYPFEFASPTPFNEHIVSRLVRILIGVKCFFFKLLKNKSIRVIHINSAPQSKALVRDALLVLISRLLKRKVVLQIHGAVSDCAYSKIVRWTAFRAFSLCHKILVFSQKDVNRIASLLPCVSAETFPNAIKAKDFIRGDNSFKSDISVPSENKIVLYLSRFIREKGVFELIDSIPEVVKRFENVNFVFAGDGPEFEQMRSVCIKKDLNKYVRFTGHLLYNDVVRVLAAADIFVLQTYYVEGFPTAILQALAAGLPIISTSAGAISDVIQDGKHGFIIEPRNPKQLTEKILFFLDNDNLRKQIGDSNARLARKKFDIEIVSRKLEKLYENL